MSLRGVNLGSSVRLADLSDNPYPIFARLRAEEPVSWVAELGMWFVTRREDVLRVLADAATFRTDSARSLLYDTFGSQMLSAEGAKQFQYKSKCFPPFRPESIHGAVREMVERKCAELIDGFPEEVELRSSFANPLAVYTVAKVLGFPIEDLHLLRSWYDDFAAALANFTRDQAVRGRGLRAANHFRSHLAPLLKTSLEGTLLHLLAQPGEGSLSQDEVLSNSMVILFGGIETTESAILNAIWALLTHRPQWEEVVRTPALIPAAIEESLRWEAAVQSCTRHAATATALGGVEIAAGDTVQCMLGSANRDPEHFENPDTFDIHRANASDHLTFGFGRHFCLGAALARLEAQIAVRTLCARMPALTLNEARSSPPQGHEFRKPHALWVKSKMGSI